MLKRARPRFPAALLAPSHVKTSTRRGGAKLTLTLTLTLRLPLPLPLPLPVPLPLPPTRCEGRNETCNNRGDCVNGQCACDLPYLGFNCSETIGCNYWDTNPTPTPTPNPYPYPHPYP